MRTYLSLLTVMALACGCGGQREPQYDGFPLKYWANRLEFEDPTVQSDALEVIASIGIEARAAEGKVRSIARSANSTELKMQAIITLQSMNAPVIEFREFIDLYNAPIIPLNDEAEPDEESDETDLMENISGDDDLEYLKALVEGRDLQPDKDTTMIPSDSAALAEWVAGRQMHSTQQLLALLKDPTVLKGILEYGDVLERRFAAAALAEIDGDEDLASILEEAQSDPDSVVQRIAAETLKRLRE